MQTIGVFEAKNHFSALLDKVGRGEQVIITKHGHPIAKLVPATKMDNARIHGSIKKLKEFNKGSTLGNLSWKTLRDKERR